MARETLTTACLVLAIASGACARKPLSPTDGTGGSGHAGGGPDSGPIGGAGNDAGGAGGGDGPADPANDAGGAWRDARADQEHLDGATRASILAPLAATDTTIDQATGAELFKLALGIGYAYGYAMCTCLLDIALSAEAIDGCARAEAVFTALLHPMQARCILDRSREVPGFDEYLRCRTKLVRDVAPGYVECAMGTSTIPPPIPGPCDASDSVKSLLGGAGCEAAFYCADGRFTQKGRCDFTFDCSDRADERGCGHFICGEKLIDPELACIPEYCPDTFTLPLCLPNNPLLFLCGDGTGTPIANLCNGVKNCLDGRDEAYCF